MNPAAPVLTAGSRRALVGFLFIGVLTAIPATALPTWNYHLQPPYLAIALHFACFALGVLAALRLSRPLLARFGSHRMLANSAALAAAAILLLEVVGPPAPAWGRHISLAIMGCALGGLMAASFQLLRHLYEQNSAATLNLAGGFLGLGALLVAFVSAVSFDWLDLRGALLLISVLGFASAAWLFRSAPPVETGQFDIGIRQALREARSPVHVLFAALLFFETAAELSVLSWTALHLILRSGMSPAMSLYLLSYYCLILLAGRFGAQAMLQHFPHRRLLLASSATSWLGILILSATDNSFGAILGLTLSAAGFSFVYPLLVERVGNRFQEYHSSLFHGIFGLAMLGGLLAPALIALVAHFTGEISAMTIPLWCSLIVFLILVAIWIESRISASRVVRS